MGRVQTRVVIADDEPMMQAVLSQTVVRAGFLPMLAGDGEQALKLLEGPGAPRIALLDWMMPRLDGVETCRRIRALPGPYVFVFLISARSRREDLIQGLDAGADSFIAKPFHPEELVARLKACDRLLSVDHRQTGDILQALDDALTNGVAGELIVQGGDAVGKILVHGGRIVWVHLSTDRVGLQSVLREEAGVVEDDLRAVFDECKRTGQNVLEMLVSWKLLAADALEGHVRVMFARKLRALLALPAPAVVFVPHAREFRGSMTFRLGELIDTPVERAVSRPIDDGFDAEPPTVTRRIFSPELVQEGLALEGAKSVAIVDPRTGLKLAAAGEETDAGLLLTGARMCRLSPEGDGVEDLLLTSLKHYHLFRLIPGSGELMVYLRLFRDGASLAMARFHLANFAAKLKI